MKGRSRMSDEKPPEQTTDVMDERWACLTCFASFSFGKLKTAPFSAKHPAGLVCPTCGCGNVHPADGESHYADEYLGEIGVRH
jgi:hypothetical protein